MQRAKGRGTYLVILEQHVGKRMDNGHILECGLAICKPSMRKDCVFDELEDGTHHVAPLGHIVARRMFLEIRGENGTVKSGDVGSGHQLERLEIDEVDGDLVGGELSKGIRPDFG